MCHFLFLAYLGLSRALAQHKLNLILIGVMLTIRLNYSIRRLTEVHYLAKPHPNEAFRVTMYIMFGGGGW